MGPSKYAAFIAGRSLFAWGRFTAAVLLVGRMIEFTHAIPAGSWGCFRLAAEYMGRFGLPAALVTGNHDLEGEEFQTDEDNLAAWTQVRIILCMCNCDGCKVT